MKRIVYLILALLGIVAIVLFTVQNMEKVEVEFLFWNIESSPAIICFASFGIGVLIASFFILPSMFTERGKLNKAEKSLKEAEQNLKLSDEKLKRTEERAALDKGEVSGE